MILGHTVKRDRSVDTLEIRVTIDPDDGFKPSTIELTITADAELFITRYAEDGTELGSTALDLRRIY